MKKVTSCIVLLAATLSTVHAQYTPVEDLDYTITNNQVTITGFDINITDLRIPPMIDGHPVTRIGDSATDYAFSSITNVVLPTSVTHIGFFAFGYSSLQSIEMPGVTHIGDRAFDNCASLSTPTLPESLISLGTCSFFGCGSLTSIILPDSLTTIGNSAFEDCSSLNSVTLPKALTTIGERAFAMCTSLTSIAFPASLESISGSAFFYCSSLTSLTLPASLNSIGLDVFGSCTSLTSISVAPENPNFASLGGVLFNKAITELITYPIGNPATTYSIPQGVEHISNRAFDGCDSLTSVTFPDMLTTIGNSAFTSCDSLTSVTFPDMLTTIGNSAFTSCDSLTSVTFPASLNSIGDSAFHDAFDHTQPFSATFLGNAPAHIGENIFSASIGGDHPAIIYIYQGATGFGDTFSGRPVVVLSPPLPIDSITVENGNLLVKTTDGTEGITIEQTDDLVDGTWTTITPTIVDGCFQLPASGTAGYYRLSNP